jgi:hypothetical protein
MTTWRRPRNFVAFAGDRPNSCEMQSAGHHTDTPAPAPATSLPPSVYQLLGTACRHQCRFVEKLPICAPAQPSCSHPERAENAAIEGPSEKLLCIRVRVRGRPHLPHFCGAACGSPHGHPERYPACSPGDSTSSNSESASDPTSAMLSELSRLQHASMAGALPYLLRT